MLTTNGLKVGIGAFLLVSFIYVSACGGPARPSQGGQDGGEGINRTVSGLIAGISSIEELARISEVVVVGTVREVSAGLWSSPDGKRPPDLSLPHSPIIFRNAIVQVEQYVKSPLAAKELAVHLRGGQVGKDTLRFSEEVTLEPGEKVLLFLRADRDPWMSGIPGYRVFAAHQGKFAIKDGLAVGVPHLGTFPLAQLIDRIRSAGR